MSHADPSTAGIAVARVAKSFGRTVALGGVDLEVPPGAFICLLGPSGCGKTTLLRCLAGLERPDAGRIGIGHQVVVDHAQGDFVPPEQRHLGMVFQHYALWPHMTVREHIAYPLRKQKVPAGEWDARIRGIMETVGLPALLDRRPAQLSGGQQQRVALARALVHAPPVLLLDEPLSNLDATLRVQLRRELRLLQRRLGMTTVLVTHDQEEAAALADIIAVMDQGRIVQTGSAAEVLDAPRNRFVAEFVGFDNIIAGHIRGTAGARVRIGIPGSGEIELPAPATAPAVGDAVIIAARSDVLRVRADGADGPGMLRGILRHIARNGRGIDLEIAAGDQIILVRETLHERRESLAPGKPVMVDFTIGTAIFAG